MDTINLEPITFAKKITVEEYDKQKDEWLWEAREGVILYNNIIYIFPTLAL